MDDRIPTDVWVAAHVRKCAASGVPVTVVRRGAEASGTVMVKIFMKGKCRLLNQTRDMDGHSAWMNVFDEDTVEESRADQYIQRAVARDPDLWVVEVEDAAGKNPFEGRVL